MTWVLVVSIMSLSRDFLWESSLRFVSKTSPSKLCVTYSVCTGSRSMVYPGHCWGERLLGKNFVKSIILSKLLILTRIHLIVIFPLLCDVWII